jgi:DNA polymerase III subunit delta'
MPSSASQPAALLERSLESGRIHSAYLVSGPGDAPRSLALRFVRGIVCSGSPRPCEACAACRRSSPREEIELDGTGKRGPLLRHVGDHADLLWVERGPDDTRVRIGQIRALQQALRLRSSEGGRRAAVVADAERLNQEAQNALLRLLEEPPPDTTLVLVATTSAGLLATLRSRCQRVALRPPRASDAADPARAERWAKLDALPRAGLPELLDWAELFRGPRAKSALQVEALLEDAASWLRHRVAQRIEGSGHDVQRALEGLHVLSACRKTLVQRNANPQMVAERALFALHDAVTR